MIQDSDLTQGTAADVCELGDEPSGTMICGELLDYLSYFQLLKEDSLHGVRYFLIYLFYIKKHISTQPMEVRVF
jgi:hypothetical protein